jgi:hypothetical protein
MSGLWGLEKKTSYRSGQRKTFTMWCNQKLVAAGANTMSVDNMKDEMKNGVVLVSMLEQLTGKTIRGINRNPKHTMTIMANLQNCWKFMEQEEGIDLGGINVTNAYGGVEKVWLALIWRFILKYDLDGDDGGAVASLLEWVRPRTEARGIDVSNFTTSWKDGDAFLAVIDSIVPGLLDIEEEKANDDPNNRVDKLQKAFDLVEEHLGVSQLLEPQDLMVHRIDHKCVMTYVAAIKRAAENYETRKVEMEEAKKNENLLHKLNGDKLYDEGMSKKVSAQTDSQDALNDITENAQKQLDDGEDDYEMLVEQANADLAAVTSRFDLAIEKFKAADEEYRLMDQGDPDDPETEQGAGVQKCAERIQECNDFVEDLKISLDKKLKDMIDNSKANKKMEDGNEEIMDVMAETGGDLADILEEARKKIHQSKNEQERIDICNAARERVKRSQKKFNQPKDTYKEAEALFIDDIGKEKAKEAQDDCDKYADELMAQFDFGLEEALLGAGENDDLEDSDLLAIYHAFSLEVESFAIEDDAADGGIERQPGVTRNRLNNIMKLLRDHKSQTDGIREKVVAACNATFDSNGYP